MMFKYLKKGDSVYCEKILRSLPDWFGIEKSTVDYIKQSKELPMIVAFENDIPIGFISIKHHSPYTSEVYVMGVIPSHRQKGVGTSLLRETEKVLSQKGVEFLQVKTVSPDNENEFYKKTRLFYFWV